MYSTCSISRTEQYKKIIIQCRRIDTCVNIEHWYRELLEFISVQRPY